jgi:hypothetical protein
MTDTITLPRTTVQRALEALAFSCPAPHLMSKHDAAETALHAALAQEEQTAQKPIAFVPVHPRNGPLWSMTTNEPSQERLPSYPLMPLYTAPPRREWKGLSRKEAYKLASDNGDFSQLINMVWEIEALLKERNDG